MERRLTQARPTTLVVRDASWRAWLGFTAMAVGMFFAILDIQIVASSMLDIQVALALPLSIPSL
jgi:hypothetical protein